MYARIGYYPTAYYPTWYNERKVSEGFAIRLDAGNFLEKTEDLNLHDIVRRFSNLEKLNQRSHQKAFHIPISFSNSDQLSIEKYKAIGNEYISRMRLGRQPYVIYLHQDTNQLHLHCVVSRIDHTGKHLDFDHKPSTLSKNAIEQIVDKYQLDRTHAIRMPNELGTLKNEPCRQDYGKSPTTQTIQNILSYVLPNYNFTNMDELNSILLQYNIYADIGRPGSLTYNNRGLAYQFYDADGRLKGGRVPAHRLPSKPGRDFLDKLFIENQQKRGENLNHLRLYLRLALIGKFDSLSSLSQSLGRDSIVINPFMNKRGLIHELAFTDFSKKVAITGSSLGPEFTAETIFSQIGYPLQFQLPGNTRKITNDEEYERRLKPPDYMRARQQLDLHERKLDTLRLSLKHERKHRIHF
ncbi:MAG: relaxase/mobilization nuclease domain-containing protein [Bacteroidetes bacterium]|nr:relaxase/mobilization nuclease domain-containing protein [Bacteroidota bacterium]